VRFELADKGTLFLDEIAAISLNLQSKLLRVLESGEFEPIGSSRTCRVNVRILSATNADIEQEVAASRFRRDLLYRLNTVRIHVPPLRRRPEEILLLAMHFLKGYVTKYRKPITGFNDAAMQGLLSYSWPGNVRQLDRTIERAVLMTQTQLIDPCDLGLQSSERPAPNFEAMTIEQMERWAIRRAMEQFDGDISKAAEALGLGRAALYRRIENFKSSKMRFERRILMFSLLSGLAGILVALVLIWALPFELSTRITLTFLILVFWIGFGFSVKSKVAFPLRTILKILGALRKGDYSMRLRGTRRDDAMGELAWEVNRLVMYLQGRRFDVLESTGLLQKILAEIDVALSTPAIYCGGSMTAVGSCSSWTTQKKLVFPPRSSDSTFV